MDIVPKNTITYAWQTQANTTYILHGVVGTAVLEV